MNFDDLDFGVYRQIAPYIVEVIIHEGVELTESMQEQAEQALDDTFDGEDYGLLVNRVHTYSHTHGSIIRVSKFSHLKALAIIAHSSASEEIAQIHTLFQDNAKVFLGRKQAMAWLEQGMTSKL